MKGYLAAQIPGVCIGVWIINVIEGANIVNVSALALAIFSSLVLFYCERMQ